MLNLKPIVPFYAILIFPVTLWADACEQANSLVFKVLNNQFSNAKPLLQRALTLCPNHAIAHNTLAVISEHEQDYHNALYHYQQTVKYSPDYFQAWVGMGDIYYQQKQLPLSLESYLQACTHYHPHAPQPENHENLLKRTRQRVADLKSRIRDVETGSVLQYESLSLLYDKARLEKLYHMATLCYIKSGKSWALHPGTSKAWVNHKVRFHNLNFDTGKDNLTQQAELQLEEIARFVGDKYSHKRLNIMGHADIQAWTGYSSRESKRLNDKLSWNRAKAVKKGLARRGISIKRMKTHGYGASKPWIEGRTAAALAQNRRVEIEVIEVKD
jgi:outer membrane protein OmpA-like peptidoglycan-associated protein